MKVDVRNGNLEAAMRQLRKKVFNEGIVRDTLARRYYTKKSDLERRKRVVGKQRARIQNRKNQLAW